MKKVTRKRKPLRKHEAKQTLIVKRRKPNTKPSRMVCLANGDAIVTKRLVIGRLGGQSFMIRRDTRQYRATVVLLVDGDVLSSDMGYAIHTGGRTYVGQGVR